MKTNQDQAALLFVQSNIISNQTKLVSHLLGYKLFDLFPETDIRNGHYAMSLNTNPIEKRYTHAELEELATDLSTQLDRESDRAIAENIAQDLGTINSAKPQYAKVREWWLCSDFLLRQLENAGELILSNQFGSWWGRTTEQDIYQDLVIRSIGKNVEQIFR